MRRTAALLLLCMACTDPATAPTPTEPSGLGPLERFEIDGRPSAITALDGFIYVADDENHNVHVLDARTGDANGEPIEVEDNPIAIAADAGVIWVAHANGVLTRIEEEELTTSKVGGSITDVIAEDGGVWVIDLEGSSAAEIDQETGEVSRGVDIPEGAVRGAVGYEGLWVSGMEDAISRIELVPFVVRHVYPDVGGGPIGLAWDGEVMWAAISDDGTVIDIQGKTFEDPIEVGKGPIALAVLDDALFVINADDQTLVEVSEGKAGDPIELETEPRDVVASDGALWVAGVNPTAVVRVEP